MTNTQNLKAGTKVLYDARSQGVLKGTITKREIIKSYYDDGNDFTYYALTPEESWKPSGLMIPATDILEVL